MSLFFKGTHSSVFFTCLLTAGTAAAQEPQSVAPARIVVTATRVPEPIDSALAPTFVITREELDRSLATDIGEILRFRAGIDVVRSGGPGQPTSIFMRGAESNHTLVLVDGVRINPGTIGSPALQNIPPEIVERIEVVKGPRSALYGSDAIGGVINIITRRDDTPGAQYSVQAGGGSEGTRQASLHSSVAGEPGHAGFDVSWLDSDGFPTRVGSTTDRGFDNLAWTARAGTQLGEFDLGARYSHSSGTSAYSDFFLTPIDQDFRNSVAALDGAVALGESWYTRMIVSRVEDRIVQNQSPDRLRTERYAVDWQHEFTLDDRNRITAGAVYADENAEARSFGTVFDVDTEVTNAYVQYQYMQAAHAVTLAGGYTDHTTFGQHATWNADFGYDFTQSTRVVLSAGTAFRAPDATDRFGFGGNPDLEPEESQQYEIGLRHRIAAHAFTLSAFQNEIDELIEFVVTDPFTFDGELRNVDRARIRGIEAGWEYSGELWQLRIEASHQDPRNRTTGDYLARRSRNSLALGVVRTFGPLELGADVLAVDDREDIGFAAPIPLDRYAVANLNARYEFAPGWSVLARIENLFDEQYELASGYNTPDRGFFFAMRYAQR